VPEDTKPRTPITVIRFTRRMALQCAGPGPGIPDWVICEAVARGTRRARPGRPGREGRLFRFEARFATGGPGVAVLVLGRVLGRECVALELLAPRPPAEKNWGRSGFLNRSVPK
jgi:hypothetical protein